VPAAHLINPSHGDEYLNGDSDHDKNAPEETPLPRFLRPEWVIIYITALYSLVSFFTLIVVNRQSKHITTSERAWIMVTMEKPIMTPQGPWRFAGMPIIKNDGKTPAFVYEAAATAIFLPSGGRLPAEPGGYKKESVLISQGKGIPVAPDNRVSRPVLSESIKDVHEIYRGELVLWVHGYVKYRDAFYRKQRVTRYCFRLLPTIDFVIDGPPAYNEVT
jgi:hypothetical protein